MTKSLCQMFLARNTSGAMGIQQTGSVNYLLKILEHPVRHIRPGVTGIRQTMTLTLANRAPALI